MKRRYQYGLAVIMLSISAIFMGCSKEGKESTTAQNQVKNGTVSMLEGIYNGEIEHNVTLRVLENDTAIEQGYFKELIEAFNEKYKEYGIVAVDANMDQYSNLEEDGPYGYGPDILYQANDSIMKYVEGKHIYPIPIDKLEDKDLISESAWNAYKASVDNMDLLMGVPVNVQSSMLYYRKDMLPDNWELMWDKNKNSIPDMVETWSDLYAYSSEIRARGDGSYGYMRSLYDVYFSSGFLFSYGGSIFKDNNTNPEEILIHDGNAEVGANVLLQLASLMNEEAIDDSITTSAYKKIADGTYFATMTTPDVYSLFIKELALEYEKYGMNKEESYQLAKENLIISNIPSLPVSGNLKDKESEQMPLKAMGGINGYAISAYTKYPNAALEFIKFATDYDMIKRRHEILGIVPARKDVATEVGGVTNIVFENLDQGNIVIMPSIREMAQVWTPFETFFQDLTKDAFRREDKKYTSNELIKANLELVSKQIYDAIYILKAE